MSTLTDIPSEIVNNHILPYLRFPERHLLRWTAKYFHGIIPNQKNYNLCIYAALDGNLKILQWALANGSPFDESVCAAAALHGRLEFLKAIRTAGFPWDKMTCTAAAAGGHFVILQWARRSGCPWDKQVCLWANHRGQEAMLKWAVDNGCPWSPFKDRYAYVEPLSLGYSGNKSA